MGFLVGPLQLLRLHCEVKQLLSLKAEGAVIPLFMPSSRDLGGVGRLIAAQLAFAFRSADKSAFWRICNIVSPVAAAEAATPDTALLNAGEIESKMAWSAAVRAPDVRHLEIASAVPAISVCKAGTSFPAPDFFASLTSTSTIGARIVTCFAARAFFSKAPATSSRPSVDAIVATVFL